MHTCVNDEMIIKWFQCHRKWEHIILLEKPLKMRMYYFIGKAMESVRAIFIFQVKALYCIIVDGRQKCCPLRFLNFLGNIDTMSNKANDKVYYYFTMNKILFVCGWKWWRYNITPDRCLFGRITMYTYMPLWNFVCEDSPIQRTFVAHREDVRRYPMKA